MKMRGQSGLYCHLPVMVFVWDRPGPSLRKVEEGIELWLPDGLGNDGCTVAILCKTVNILV
jgi:hypothetical protein